MEKTFTDHVVEINEMTNGNYLLRSLILGSFYENLPENIQKQFKNILDKFHFSPRNKIGWKCNHKECQRESCYSHEISENSFLKNISDENSMVTVLKRDMKNNPISFIEKEIHKRNATNFPGYCSLHDDALFNDIENEEPVFNDYFVNKQCLRTARKRRFEVELKIKTAADFLESIPIDAREVEPIKQAIMNIERKVDILESQLKRINDIYTQIQAGIESQEFAIQFFEMEAKRSGYFFSACLDLTYEIDEFPYILFLFKFDFKSKAKAFACILKNNKSSALDKDISSNLSDLFMNAIYEEKENLIFSKHFLVNLSATSKSILYRDTELHEITKIERVIMCNEFF